MDVDAMRPFGKALRACLEGDDMAELLVRRDDGSESALPIKHFFRSEAEFCEIERIAVERCRGRVLDVGAGAGAVTRVLEERGLAVTALDICPEALEVARRRGVREAVRADVLAYEGGPFDTVLMLGHGIGMVETLAGLDRFLVHAPSLLGEGGQILVDSLDARVTDDPADLRYHEFSRRLGRYVGEVRMQFRFRDDTGPFCGWLHADAETLAAHARATGWRMAVLVEGRRGEYLAELTRPGRL
jgi:SAM-dependent methyltransferase